MRALGALAVLAYHAAALTGLTTGPAAGASAVAPWLQHLNVGVSVFFVLSGFLLFRPFVVAHLTGRTAPALGPYLLRRAVRIYPAYWVALAASVRLLHLDLGDGWSQVRYWTLTQIYWGDTVLGGLTQAWSLCTEVSFYLFLPVWAAALARRRGGVEAKARAHLAALAVLYVGGLAVRTGLRAGGHAIGYATLPANVDLFALGMALAVVHAAMAAQGRPAGGLARTVGELPGAAWAAAACCYAGAVSLRYPFGFDPPTVAQEVLRQVLFGLVAVLVVATGVFGPQDQGLVRRALRWRPLVWAGVVSYGIYLWHVTVMARLMAWSLVGPTPSAVVLTAWAVPLSVAIASASWIVLERPLLARVRSRRRRSGGSERREPSSSLAP